MEQIPAVSDVTLSPPIPSDNKYHLAFIIDNVVVSTVLTDARNAAIFTSSPTIVQIDIPSPISEGWTYDGNGFSAPTV